MRPFVNRLLDSQPLLLDGATGTELNRRGVDTSLPLWSAAALLDAEAVVRQVHTDYVDAGAELVTANTFRCHARNLANAGLAQRAAELTRRAVQLARDASAGRAYVAGSQAPLEDCCSSSCVPAESALDALDELRAAAPDMRLGVYANIGRPDPVQGWINSDAEQPESYALVACQWQARGAQLIGGCCGTTPAHIAAICRRMGQLAKPR